MQPTIDTFHTHLRTYALPYLRDAQAAEYGAAFVLLAMLDLDVTKHPHRCRCMQPERCPALRQTLSSACGRRCPLPR